MIFALPSPAHAVCLDPPGMEGDQIYNNSFGSGVMQYCDGDDWISMDGSIVPDLTPDHLGNHTASANIDMTGFNIINLGTPSDAADAATKAYVDSLTGTAETDPKVGTLLATKWCKGDAAGTAIECTHDLPAGGGSTGQCVAWDQKSSNTGGGAATTGWHKRALTNITCQGIADVSIAANSLTLPAGDYYVDALVPFYLGNGQMARARLIAPGPAILAEGSSMLSAGTGTDYVRIVGNFSLSEPTALDLQYWAPTVASTHALGYPADKTGTPEIYTTMYIKMVSSTPAPTASCTLDGETVLHGGSRTFYSATSHANCASISLSRTCTNGTLSGSNTFQFANCGAPTATCTVDANCQSSGKCLGGFCWYATTSSCNSVCTSLGGVNMAGTRDWAGSGGTNANCTTIGQAFVNRPPANYNIYDGFDPAQYGPFNGLGCLASLTSTEGGDVIYLGVRSTAATNAALTTPADAVRFCACNSVVSSDTTPDAFTFPDLTNQALNTQIGSGAVTITGINAAAAVSVTGDGSPQVNINGGGWVTSGTVMSGQQIQIRLLSANAPATTRNATINVGGVTDTWSVTTGTPNCSTDANCSSGGKCVGGNCWYASPLQTCTQACSSRGGYNAATLFYAGSSGTNANCASVINAVLEAGISAGDVSENDGSFMAGTGECGCSYAFTPPTPPSVYYTYYYLRGTLPTTAACNGLIRMCACNN